MKLQKVEKRKKNKV